ncbi:alpha/beta hydrolase fold protein [Thalassoporum mexicanum PCC 7367]|uniref:alpha/beta hydrolase n=1 Tax=Thalassoporum mexicanum TaxID=3457544 RepID=UPI00029FC9B7|nr:alpha/beta hydrolase [Pseudanabaena sp. PCC 7367]AFY68519.1 alpha/beta hydrolase fold protein [Pseudanabaena sp. PCC 7367]
MKKHLKKIAIGLISLAVLGYGGICAYFGLGQRKMIYFPWGCGQTSDYPAKVPTDLGIDYEEVWLRENESDRIHAWWVPNDLKQQKPSKVIIYFHGNGGNLSEYVYVTERLHKAGFSVLIINYRGYGCSGGDFPQEANIYEDAQTALNYLIEKKQIPPTDILAYGYSLGGAVAIDLAAKNPDLGGLVVEGGFTSMLDMASFNAPSWIPINLLLTERFDSIAKIPNLDMPVLFFHGTEDEIIPTYMSEKLYEVAPEPKALVLVPNADHGNTAELAGSKYAQEIWELVERSQVIDMSVKQNP